jgi:hypothetical protein
MPNYKYNQFLHQSTSTAFDQVYTPGVLAPYSGIYRCDACGFEASSTQGHPLPPARDCGSHHPRWRCQPGQVRWRLVASSIHTSN